NADVRPHPRMPQFALGGSPAGGRQGVLHRAKVMLSERNAGRGASPPVIEGAPGGNRSYGSPSYPPANEHTISLPSPTSPPGQTATLRRDIAPEAKPDKRNPGGKNFAFGGGAMGGRGRDRTA